ncbi:MAG: LuxR C-terminal-related transcriptional regulator [Gammaproteobacteria bacterium]|nr:LuxR C-terminal-related transcriptional regulator [Gammaproteobacteria bacterium]
MISQADNKKEMVLIAILALVILGGGVDLYTDVLHGATTQHILKETAVVLIAAIAMAWLWLGLRRQDRELRQLREEYRQLDQAAQAASDYVLAGRRQMRDVAGRQFDDWGLTQSEKDVAWLLLKGLSLKEIAAVRNTLEKTVRQQASAIYKKAGVDGRHAFAAWFLEDMM